MNDQPVHRLYLHFEELPISRRLLYTATLLVLAAGYAFALLYVYASDAANDGNPVTLSVQDIIIHYSGSAEGTRLESALRGPMSSMLPEQQLAGVLRWITEGAERPVYEASIRPVIERYCLACHDGSNPHLDNLDGYDNLSAVIELDTGADIFTLVRVSHIHLFGLTFIFFIIGLIFTHAFVRPIWFKGAVVTAPFVGLTMDISAWYFTKLFNPFAWMVIVGGALMASSFAFMWFVSLYQLWFYRLPEHIAQRDVDVTRTIG